jgi:hypothetical protein
MPRTRQAGPTRGRRHGHGRAGDRRRLAGAGVPAAPRRPGRVKWGLPSGPRRVAAGGCGAAARVDYEAARGVQGIFHRRHQRHPRLVPIRG